jgi:acetyltransferase-like isoleucine patch superfamily enzyme
MYNVKLFFISTFIHCFPETRLFSLKRSLYRFVGIQIGNGVRICSSVKFTGCGKITIGDNTWIGPNTIIASSSNIVIGADVDIAPLVYIGTGTHVIDINSPNVAGSGVSYDITVCDGCWIGVRATILPGVHIGKKSIIAAGAVLNREAESLSVYGGVPAKLIRHLNS